MPNVINKSIVVSILANAVNQDVLSSYPDLKQMLFDGTVSLLATQPSGAHPLSVTFQVGTEIPAKDSTPNATGNPPRIDFDVIVNAEPAYRGTPIIFTANNSSAAAVDLTAQVVQQKAILA